MSRSGPTHPPAILYTGRIGTGAGNRTLAEALQNSSAKAETIIEEIKGITPSDDSQNPATLGSSELIDYLLENYHDILTCQF